MRITGQVIEVEAIIGALLSDDRSWAVWHDDHGKRPVHLPTFVAFHIPSQRIIGVYVRPMKLHPSEMPAVDWLPVTVEPVVWHPGLSTEVRAWLAAPVGEAPGAVSTARRPMSPIVGERE